MLKNNKKKKFSLELCTFLNTTSHQSNYYLSLFERERLWQKLSTDMKAPQINCSNTKEVLVKNAALY